MNRLLLLLPLAACAATSEPPAAADDAPAVDGDCPVDPSLFLDATTEVTPTETVLRVGWSTAAPVAARVIYTANGQSLATPLGELGTDGEALVVGLRPNHVVDVQVEALLAGDGDERRCSAPMRVLTGALPSDLPAPIVTVNDPDRAVRGWQSVAVIREQTRYATLLDADGQFVWASPVGGLFRATLSLDRTAMLANRPANVWDGDGELFRIPLDGSDPTILTVPGSHTDFVELPDGTIATLGWTTRQYGERSLLGDTIIEVRPDGTQVVIWDLFDHVTPDLSVEYDTSSVASEDDPDLEEWSHVNSIAYDAQSDDYVVTGTFNHAVMRVDRATGALEWTLADDPGVTDWPITSADVEIDHPHSAQLVDDDTVLVFSRGALGSPDQPTPCAWVSELDLDPTSGTAAPAWRWSSESCVTVPFLGQARRIAGGDTLVNWTAAGRLSQTTADGEVVLQVDLGLGAAFGSGEWVEGVY